MATSYLGVAGTLIGAAFASIATTAGATVYQHYLDRGKSRYVPRVTGEIKHRVAGRTAQFAASARSAVTLRESPAAEDRAPATRERPVQGRPSAQESEVQESEAQEPGTGEPGTGESDAAEPGVREEEPDVRRPVARQEGAGTRAVRQPRWYTLTGTALAIFAVVIGGITLVESLTHKPVSTMLGRSDRGGTSLGGTFGGGSGDAADHPVAPSNSVTPTSSPTAVPSGIPSSGSSQPATAPILPPPTSPSATATTRPPVVPSPTTPTTRLGSTSP